MMLKTKKGVELSLQTVVLFILGIIVLIVMIYFFSDQFASNSDTLFTAGDSIIEDQFLE